MYVDDIVLSGDSGEEMDKLKGLLPKEFKIKDLGNLKYFLGMKVAQTKKGILYLKENIYLIVSRKLE